MVISNSLVYQNRSIDSIELFDKLYRCKCSFFPKKEVNRYVSIGAVTCTNVCGNRYRIASNTSDDVVEVVLR